jgi:uncharacterized protein YndB with AHSA1/START domain
MGVITHSIEVNAPLQTVYDHWTQFEEFPRFMEGVHEVRQDGPNRLFWNAKIGGKEKQWEAEITEQVPNKRIAWQSVDGAPNTGAVTFESLDPAHTRITLTMEYEPEGLFEKVGDALGIPSGRVEGDLKRFREFIEDGENETGETGAWRAQTEQVEMPDLTEQAITREDVFGVEELPKQKVEVEDREIMPEAVIIEEIPSGTDGIGSGAIARREDEPIQKTEDGTEVADEPPPNAVKRPSVAESVEMYRGKVGVAGPTYEQIAHRAYELYLERGERSNGDREDWLAAENELSERYRDNGPA